MSKPMRIYAGIRHPEGHNTVTVNGEPLNPRFDLRNHSPPGFEWGYGGSGPAQLALAIMADHFQGRDDHAEEIYQAFKFYVIGGLKKDRWTLTTHDCDRFLKDIRSGKIPS